jgi:hypothetical protein
MNKHIRQSIVEGNETETLLSIEKLHGTDWHYHPPKRAHAARFEPGAYVVSFNSSITFVTPVTASNAST